jgi:hypothetical protein
MPRVRLTFLITNLQLFYVNSLGAYMQKVFQWLQANSGPWAHWATVFTFMAVCFGGYLAYAQLELVNEQRRWQNFNDMNVRYADLYRNIPPEIASGCRLADFEKLEPKTKIWVRQFFDLYSEEYWLYLNKLIPEEMWTHRISSGVRVNLNTYPAIIDGYYYWAARNSFTHPNTFQSEAESAIDDAKPGRMCRPQGGASIRNSLKTGKQTK